MGDRLRRRFRHGTRAAVLAFALICCHTATARVELTAVITSDNDFTTNVKPSGSIIPVPAPVAQKIDALVDKAYSQFKCDSHEDCFTLRSDFYGPIFRLAAPNQRHLYVFRRIAPLGVEFYFFILFDPKTKQLTEDPPYISAKWMEGDWGAKVQKPLLSFDDLDGDGQQEVVVQERVHNGTMYNAVVYHYFHILPDLRLRRILALETRLFDLFTEQDGGVIIRTPQKLGNRRLRLEVFLELPGPPARQRKLGDVMLSSPAPGSPFEIEERHPLDPRYSDLLITAAEDDEAKFLREGYGFYY